MRKSCKIQPYNVSTMYGIFSPNWTIVISEKFVVTPNFLFWIPIILAKICFSRIVINWAKINLFCFLKKVAFLWTSWDAQNACAVAKGSAVLNWFSRLIFGKLSFVFLSVSAARITPHTLSFVKKLVSTFGIGFESVSSVSSTFSSAASESLARRAQATAQDPVFQRLKEQFSIDFDFR